jgi:hypothetical protein
MAKDTPHALQIILADTFLDSLADLEKDEQLRALAFLQEIRRSTKSTGASLERLRNTRSKNLWSGRIDRDLRAILYREGESLTILHAGHHIPAYRWAERRDIGRHPITGALQIIDTIEIVREVEREVVIEPSATPLLATHEDAYLLSLGVPATWLPTLRKVTDNDQLLTLALRLPPDVGDRLLLLEQAAIPTHVLSADDDGDNSAVRVGTMHRAKGLEFKAVLVAAATDKLLPYHLVLSQATDPLDRERGSDNERRLLYVALTRARDEARITWHRQPSPFLAVLQPQEPTHEQAKT